MRTHPERRCNDHALVADLVAKALDDNRLVGGKRSLGWAMTRACYSRTVWESGGVKTERTMMTTKPFAAFGSTPSPRTKAARNRV